MIGSAKSSSCSLHKISLDKLLSKSERVNASNISRKQSEIMVKVDFFDINFSNNDAVYFAGQEMSGMLVLVLKEDKKINEILLELKGKAKTYWTKHSGKSRKHCSDSEPYFCEQFNTEYTHQFPQDTEKEERTIPAGRHEIPFNLTLPKTLPSSFEGDYGFVRYTCAATLERPWDFDIAARRAFTVVGVEDINEDTKALDPVRLSDSNFDIRFCCRKQGTISVNVSLPRTGYAAGEKVCINAEVNNESQKTLRYSCARIKQHICYRAKTFAGHEESKQESKVIVKKEKGEIAPRTSIKWENERLPIPPVPPKLARCRIIDISYTLEFEVDPGIVIISPLIIGTIPLSEESKLVNHLRAAQQNSSLTSKDGAVTVTVTDEQGQVVGGPAESDAQRKKRVRMPSSVLKELYPTMKAPTYEDSLFGKTDISSGKESNVLFGESKFAPKYPCYRDTSY